MRSYNLNRAKVFVINLCMTLAFIAMFQLVVRAENSYSFACNSVKNGKRVVPTTMILFSNGKSKPLIRWESNPFPKSKQQCEEVSKRFDDFSRRGDLRFLKFANGENGKPMICGLSRANKDRSCDQGNKLFNLSKAMNNDPRKVLTGIRNSLVMVDGGSITQGSEITQIVDLAASIEQSQLDLSK
jgi:Circadian oscillating protein COP23